MKDAEQIGLWQEAPAGPHGCVLDDDRRAALKPWLGKFAVGDAVETMREMPSGTIDLIVTSPPYNLLNSTGSGMKNGHSSKWPKAELMKGYAEHADMMPPADYVRWQRACLAAMLRILTPTGAIFYNHKWRVQSGLCQDRHDIVDGFPVRQIIVWKRDGGINFNPGYFLPTYEVVYLICKPDFVLAPKANAVGDVWSISQETHNDHPAPFPVELAERCIQSTTANVVLDPFMGSGTTAVAAELCGRAWIGIDKSARYARMAERRLNSVFGP